MTDKKVKKFQIAKTRNVVEAKEIESGLNAIMSFGNNDDELYIKDSGNFFSEQFTTSEIITNEDLVRIVKKIEKLVRGSYEYKQYLAYLYEFLRIEKCSIFSNIDFSEDVKLEFHHTPLTLFDICSVIISHRLANNQPITSLTVADEVINAHCRNTIGLIPLSTTAHRLVHADILKIHHKQVIGDWIKFLREYKDGVSPEIITKCLTFMKISEEEVNESYTKLAFDSMNIRHSTSNEVDRLEQLQVFTVNSIEDNTND